MFGRGFSTVTAGSSPTARNLLFHPIGSLPAEGPTSRVFPVVHESADENNTALDDVVGFCAKHPCAFPHEVKAPEANPEAGEYDEERFHGRDFTGRLAWRSIPLIARPRHLGFSPSRGRAALDLCHDPARHQRGLSFRHLHEPSAKGGTAPGPAVGDVQHIRRQAQRLQVALPFRGRRLAPRSAQTVRSRLCSGRLFSYRRLASICSISSTRKRTIRPCRIGLVMPFRSRRKRVISDPGNG